MNQRILAFGIVVTAAAWSLAGYGLSTDRQNARLHAEQNGLNLARAFAQSTERMFGSIDYTLRRLRDDYRAGPKGFSLAAWTKQWPLAQNQVQDLLITDAKGNVVQHSDSSKPQDLVKIDAETLAAYAGKSQDAIHIGRPLGGHDGGGALHVSRPILDKSGNLAGLVVASIQPDNLSEFYRNVDVGRNGFVSIVGNDGFTRARAPLTAPLAEPAVVGRRATAKTPALTEGCGTATSWVDSIERLVCTHEVADLPLVVEIGVATDDIFAAYRTAHVRYVQAASAITLVFVIMGLWLVRHEQKLVRATHALRASEQHSAQKSDILEVTLENMSQGIVLIEADSRITVINRRAQELLGLPDSLINEDLTLEKLLQCLWDNGEFGKDGEALDPAVRKFFISGGLANSPPVYVRKRPNGIVIEARTVMLPGGGAVRTFTDITEHQRTEEQLAAAKEAAEAGYKSKSAFLATMSHEIRTPLNGVIGTASLLLETELTHEQRKSVETIQDCSDILLELINDVLDFSKLEAGRLDLEQREFELLDTCEEAFKIIDNRARSKNVTLVFAPRDNLPARIVGDPARLRQVLLNLIGNAVKFTENGAVILRTLRVERGGVARLRFEVQDTGIGISPEAKARLFTEFTQVEASITRRYGGTGLGLAICKKIVAAMDGEIGVESREGHGSTFWFELPLVTTEAAPSPMFPRVEGELVVVLIGAEDAGRAAVASLMEALGIRVIASDRAEQLGIADVAIVNIHHPLALDLVRRATPEGAAPGLSFIGYGFGSLALSSGALRLINGAVTPSSMMAALAGPDHISEHAASQKVPPTPPKRSSTRLAILLAEDNAVNQRIASTMLRNMGHSVDIAGNGLDAVAKAQIRIYDVIVMDMQMPGMDGLEATRAIREQPGPSGQVPIIAMTANAFATDRNACLEAGMNDFISKPITARKLFDAIEPWASGIAREDEQADPDDPDDASLGSAPEEAAASVAAPPVDPSLIDARQMGMIQDEVGTDGLHELLISFWADAAGLLAELEQALTAEDYRSASAVLHTLKGAAANLGLSGCGAACADARADIAEGRAPDVGELLTIMFKTLQATQPRIVEAAGAINAEAA